MHTQNISIYARFFLIHVLLVPSSSVKKGDSVVAWNDLVQAFPENMRDSIRHLVNASLRVAPATDTSFLARYKCALASLLVTVYEDQQMSAHSLMTINTIHDWIENNYDLLLSDHLQRVEQDDNVNVDEGSSSGRESNVLQEYDCTSLATDNLQKLLSGTSAFTELSDTKWSIYLNNESIVAHWNGLLSAFPETLRDCIRYLVEASFQVAPYNNVHLVTFKSYLYCLLRIVYNNNQLLNASLNDHYNFLQNWMDNIYDVLRCAIGQVGSHGLMQMSVASSLSSGHYR
jgi:hypothetical protein